MPDRVLPPMIRFAQAYLGRQWRPECVEANYPAGHHAAETRDWLGCDVRFATPGIGIVMRRELTQARLKRPLSGQVPLTCNDVVQASSSDSRADFVSAIYDIVRVRLMAGQTDIDGAARLCRLGPRSLQRRLRAESTNYRRILEDVRINRATGLIAESDLTVVEIAESLGYE